MRSTQFDDHFPLEEEPDESRGRRNRCDSDTCGRSYFLFQEALVNSDPYPEMLMGGAGRDFER